MKILLRIIKIENLILINFILKCILFIFFFFIFYIDIDFLYSEEIKRITNEKDNDSWLIKREKEDFKMVEIGEIKRITNEEDDDSWLTEREKEDLKIAGQIIINFLKILILLFSLAGFSVLLFCCILVFDIANAHRYQRPT